MVRGPTGEVYGVITGTCLLLPLKEVTLMELEEFLMRLLKISGM
jgi:hypothetical protein